jgi:hypothetical protein
VDLERRPLLHVEEHQPLQGQEDRPEMSLGRSAESTPQGHGLLLPRQDRGDGVDQPHLLVQKGAATELLGREGQLAGWRDVSSGRVAHPARIRPRRAAGKSRPRVRACRQESGRSWRLLEEGVRELPIDLDLVNSITVKVRSSSVIRTARITPGR